MRRVLLVGAAALLSACGELNPATLEFVGVIPSEPRIGETATVQFQARDERGEPMAGVTLQFSLQGDPDPETSGVTLHNQTAITNRGSGIAETQLTATRVQAVVVVATAGDKTAVSPPITFAGVGTPNGRQFTFQCGETAGDFSGGIHALGAYDDTRHLIAGVKALCWAHVGDRNGDGIPGVVVSFLTEAGTLGPSSTSISDTIGAASVLYKTSLPLPKEVAPGTFTFAPTNDDRHTGALLAPMWLHPFDWKQNPILNFFDPPDLQEPRRFDPVRGTSQLNNVRDNLVTMIAVTVGEEGYIDSNNNGRYDEGEPYDDLTEPFVDANDNGTWDPDERWVDANGDGDWNPKNNVHDSNTLIWVAERIIWTGIPHVRDLEDVVSPTFREITPPPTIPHGGNARVEVLISDPWFNSMAQNGTSDGCGGKGIANLVEVFPERFGGNGWLGQALSYPSPTLLEFHLGDGHDLLKNPPDPPFSPPVNFTTGMSCEFTSSPIEGYILELPFYVSGSVE